jgi:phage-related protein
MFEIHYYKDRKGNEAVKNWIDQLDEKPNKQNQALLKKINFQLKMLENLGLKLSEPQAKFIKNQKYPLYELRPMRNRIFYAGYDGDKFVLLHYFLKQTNKTPQKEIDIAIRNLKDWIARKG